MLLEGDQAEDVSRGPEQGVIRDAQRRRRLRWIRNSAIALVVLLGLGFAMTRGGGTHIEPRLHLPPEPVPTPPRSLPGGVSVTLSPDLAGADAGWCVTVTYQGGSGGGTCSPLPTQSSPVLAELAGAGGGERFATTVRVVGPNVARVRVDGKRDVATVADSSLPYGMRVAVIRTPIPPRYGINFPSSLIPKLVALDGAGNPAVRSPDDGTGIHFTDWNRPQPEAHGACQLHVDGLPGVTAEWGQVASTIAGYKGRIIGRGFLSCMDIQYSFPGIPGWGLKAAVLLDAASPNQAAPALIPGLAPVHQAPGIYNGAGAGVGPLTARREGNAWIVVAGGGPRAEEARIRLARHLTVTVGG
jgi:hypothetical protein